MRESLDREMVHFGNRENGASIVQTLAMVGFDGKIKSKLNKVSCLGGLKRLALDRCYECGVRSRFLAFLTKDGST